ncbi:hypothetical protein BpHYR1_006167 [Brachionus plicatilis]|uniref:RNA-directed DNA polymerase from mobile element jockey-like n=1 Tax=Brachionus plicatilis TaxID=10195 RepID=A0A3M7QZG5_BRAPC|nr:hypothetical protein BpHYR1_006167 [Brachionus plicatilis]
MNSKGTKHFDFEKLQETWCIDKSELMNIFGDDHNYRIYFKAACLSNGRKYAGKGWVVNIKINRHEATFINERVSILKIVIISGDFNCDILRKNQHDKFMVKWLNTNKLIYQDIIQVRDIYYTYFKANVTSCVDHIVTNENFKEDKIINSNWYCGDHLPLSTTVNENMNESISKPEVKPKRIIVWNEKTKKKIC